MAGQCQENQQWQTTSYFVWFVQTWAVNTHYATGTVEGIPLFMVQINLGSDSPPVNNPFRLIKAGVPKYLVFKKFQSEHLTQEK